MNKSEFWKKHLNWFIPFVSEFYPLSKYQLIQYEELWDWDRIKTNTFIRWTDDVLECFTERLEEATEVDQIAFYLPFDEKEEAFVPIYIDYPKSDKIYLREEEKTSAKQVSWQKLSFGAFEWIDYDETQLMALIERIDCGVDIGTDPFRNLPMPTQFLIKKKEYLDWEVLSGHWGLKWSFELLEMFSSYWVTEKLITNQTAFNYCLKKDLNDAFIEEVLS